MSTAIEWTDATWNPVTGCTKVSPGCANCYIERTPPMRAKGRAFIRGNIPVTLPPDRLDQPLHWRKPRRVFVVSMGDLFHEDVPWGFIADVWAVMRRARNHTFQVLTKRPERMLGFMRWVESTNWALAEVRQAGNWPLPNVHLGVSVENQRMADERIPLLLETPAAVRFLSCEPLLGPLDLTLWMCEQDPILAKIHGPRAKLDWVIVGGESGPGRAERKLVERCMGPMTIIGKPSCRHHHACNGTNWLPKLEALEWLRSIRDQCQAAGVPFFFKQWGGPKPKSGGRLLDDREHNEMPS